ncbi:MAG: hypothetical protein AB1480_15705 [Nitrospirota bacterium]
MKKLWIFTGILALLFLTMSDNAFSKSSENKAACEKWCNDNKPKCAFCDSDAFCGGRTYDVIQSFKKGTGNWYACGLSEYGSETQKNKAECEAYCKSNPDCVKCTSDACGSGIKILKTFGGKGENWHACEKTKWTEHSEEAHAAAIKWCADYKKETGEECKIVKSGQSCPDGFYKSERLKVSWGRDYKVCLKSKSDSQRVKDCSGKATANIEKALDWINTHYDTIVGDFRMQPRDYRDRRAHERMDRKFELVTVQCEDQRNKCKNNPKLGGWSSGARYVNLCYNHHEKFCQLVGTIVHESGHNAWVDMDWSQHVGDPGAMNDTVYQFGYRAEDLCTGKDKRGTHIVPVGSTSYDFDLK